MWHWISKSLKIRLFVSQRPTLCPRLIVDGYLVAGDSLLPWTKKNLPSVSRAYFIEHTWKKSSGGVRATRTSFCVSCWRRQHLGMWPFCFTATHTSNRSIIMNSWRQSNKCNGRAMEGKENKSRVIEGSVICSKTLEHPQEFPILTSLFLIFWKKRRKKHTLSNSTLSNFPIF